MHFGNYLQMNSHQEWASMTHQDLHPFSRASSFQGSGAASLTRAVSKVLRRSLPTLLDSRSSVRNGHALQARAIGAGDSFEEIKKNMVEALNLYFGHNHRPLIVESDIQLTLDIGSFFEFYKVINAKALSERIGMNQSLLAQYIKGNKRASPTQTQRILKGVQQVGRELAEIRFLV